MEESCLYLYQFCKRSQGKVSRALNIFSEPTRKKMSSRRTSQSSLTYAQAMSCTCAKGKCKLEFTYGLVLCATLLKELPHCLPLGRQTWETHYSVPQLIVSPVWRGLGSNHSLTLSSVADSARWPQGSALVISASPQGGQENPKVPKLRKLMLCSWT